MPETRLGLSAARQDAERSGRPRVPSVPAPSLRARGARVSERLIVVDGYNLILRTAALKPGPGRTLREARTKLVNLLSWAYGSGDARFVVVFDGDETPGREESSGRVDVRFSRPPQKAD